MSGPQSISVDAPAVRWGLGLFETMLVLSGRPVLEWRHFERMRISARDLGVPVPSERQWTDAVEATIAPAVRGERMLRCSWLAEGSDVGDAASWVLSAVEGAIPAATLRRRERGSVVLLEPELRRSLPAIKSTSWLSCVVGLERAKRRDADEGLFVDGAGGVLEGTSTNLFVVEGELLITPPITAGILPGIMRAWVMEQAPSLGLSVREEILTPSMLRAGSFMTSSLTGFAPIHRLDGEPCRAPEATVRRLRERFQAVVPG